MTTARPLMGRDHDESIKLKFREAKQRLLFSSETKKKEENSTLDDRRRIMKGARTDKSLPRFSIPPLRLITSLHGSLRFSRLTTNNLATFTMKELYAWL